jgi:hypothetical protein
VAETLFEYKPECTKNRTTQIEMAGRYEERFTRAEEKLWKQKANNREECPSIVRGPRFTEDRGVEE